MRRVLLAMVTDADADRVARALGPRWVVEVLASEAWPGDWSNVAAVVLGTPTDQALALWRARLPPPGDGGLTSPVSLVALGDSPDAPVVDRWLAAGADDCAFRSSLEVLAATLARLARDQAVEEARARAEVRDRALTAELLQLARGLHFRRDDFETAVREVTQGGARGMSVTRCGVWLLDDTHATLRLVDRYDARLDRHESGAVLAPVAYRGALAPLLGQRVLASTEVGEDPRLRPLVGSQTRSAMLLGLSEGSELVGVLLLEHEGETRGWSGGDEAFAGALVDAIELALEAAARRKMELALSESERRFRDLFLHTSDVTVLYRVALDGTVFCEDFNPAAEASTGLRRDDVIGRQAHEVLEPVSASKLAERFQEAIATRSAVAYEHQLELPSGSRWFSTAIVPLLDEVGRVHRLASIARDITTQKEREATQRRIEQAGADAQKSDALSRFATHVARGVDDLLSGVTAQARRLAAEGGEVGQIGRAILESVARGRALTRQVLTYGGQHPARKRPLELGALVEAAVRQVTASASEVTAVADLPQVAVEVLGDEGQLSQVLTSLCANAIEALPQARGTLTVSVRSVTVDESLARRHPPLKSGPWVRVSVSDSGRGMDDETVQRIFEPFFSARRDAEGGSLGLAVAQRIIQGHDGVVVVDSALGRGSTFHVYLPSLALGDEARPGAGQHVMLVDDHPGMARVSAKLLETLGYQTSVFDDPRVALEAFRARPSGFDVVMTDLSMPQMSGEEFTRSLRELSQTVPVIVSSGMASEADREELHRLGFSGVLLKPWRLEEAVATLQRVLPGGPRPS